MPHLVTPSAPATSSTDGWNAEGHTWTYDSADAPTFVASVNADVTGELSVGMRIKLTQTTVKYFLVTAVGAFSAGATLVTLYGGTDYVLANAAITLPAYSSAKAPFGFPLDPAKWTESFSGNPDNITTTGAQQFVNPPCQLDVPIGAWSLSFRANPALRGTGTTVSNVYGEIGLSLVTNGFGADEKLTGALGSREDGPTTTFRIAECSIQRSANVTHVSTTRWYLVGFVTATGTGISGQQFQFNSENGDPITIEAVSAYL